MSVKTPRKSQRKPQQSDALRVLLALVFILFASMASRDHETPEKIQEARAIAATQTETHPKHTREEKHKLPEVPFISRINGSL